LSERAARRHVPLTAEPLIYYHGNRPSLAGAH
jgi:hypothetical protein